MDDGRAGRREGAATTPTAAVPYHVVWVPVQQLARWGVPREANFTYWLHLPQLPASTCRQTRFLAVSGTASSAGPVPLARPTLPVQLVCSLRSSPAHDNKTKSPDARLHVQAGGGWGERHVPS